MRVLHVLTALGHGGAEIWLLNLIAPLRELGVTIDFALKAPHLGNLRHVAEERSATTFHVPLRATQVDYVYGLARLAKEGRYDLVHVHDFVYAGLGVFAARRARRPCVLTFHHYTFEAQTPFTRRFGVRHARELYGRLNLRYAIARADALTALSKTVMSRVVPGYATNPRCHFLRLSTESRARLDVGRRAQLRAELGLPSSAPVIVHVGRFIDQKNHEGLLRIFRTVLADRPDAKLVFMGQGPLQAQILRSARDLIAAGSAKFLGLRDDVQDIFSVSDVLLFPSINEGFGLVALEANACGLPVVGTNIPGLDEAVVDGATARLFPIADEVGMARATLELLRDPSSARALGEAGRRRAEDMFSHHSSAALLVDLYRRLVK